MKSHSIKSNTYAAKCRTPVARAAVTYKEAIRRACRAEFIKPDAPATKKTKYKFTQEYVQAFVQEFCFLSEISKKVGKKRTVISSLLKSCGVRLYSGPGKDGGLIPVYKRSDIDKIDIPHHLETKNFKSRAGRKKAGEQLYDKQKWVKTKEVGRLMGLCSQEISELNKLGWLKAGVPRGRECDNKRYFTKESVDRTISKWGDYIELNQAVEGLEIPKSEFYKRFVRTGLVQVLRVLKKKRIHRDELEIARQQCMEFVSLGTADKMVGGFKHFRNLVNTGRITPVSVSECVSARELALIRREHVFLHVISQKDVA